MGLDVEPPEPPDLTNRGLPRGLDIETGVGGYDLHREELEDILREGAWTEAVNEWAEYTDLTESEYRTLQDRELFQALDVYWDPTESVVRFELPVLSEEFPDEPELRERALLELSDLGDTLLELLEESYVDWDEPGTGPSWTNEAFSEEPTGTE